MSEKRLNNTIFLMYLVSENYRTAHHITARKFLKLDKEYDILNYVSECPDIFDSMTADETVEEIKRYLSYLYHSGRPQRSACPVSIEGRAGADKDLWYGSGSYVPKRYIRP